MNSEILEQIESIKAKYPDTEQPNSEIAYLVIKLHEKIIISLDLTKYPKKPKITIEKELERILGKPKDFLTTMANWRKNNNPEVTEVLDEFKRVIDINSSEDVLITKELINGIIKWATDMRPNEVRAFIDREKGVYSTFVLSEKGISRTEDWRYGFTKDQRIDGAIYTHIDGDVKPRDSELKVFKLHDINLVLGNPYSIENIRCYDNKGRELDFKLID